MTPTSLILHVDEAIEKALRHQSWIDKEILDIKGFATGTMRRMFSNLCHLPKSDPVYCEVGLYCGATFCSAINNNPTLTAIGYEDFSQDFSVENIRGMLEANVERYKAGAKSVTVIDGDFFKCDPFGMMPPVDIFYYDGRHDYAFQRNALLHIFDFLSDLFLIIVDDYSWSCVREGTRDALSELKDKVKVEKEWVLSGSRIADDLTWHNQVFLAVCSKIK